MGLKHEVKTEQMQETAALYSLGALSQREARAFEEHLGDPCHLCEEEARAFETVVTRLGFASSEETPPEYLRDLLLRRIERVPPSIAPVLRFPETPPLSAVSQEGMKVKYLPWAIAASLAFVALASIIFWKQANDKTTRLREELAAARSEQLLDAEESERIKATIGSSNLRLIQMGGQEPAPQSSGNIYWDMKENRWVVTVILPPPPAGKVYQLWFVTPEAKISAGLIKTKADGKGSIIVDVPPGLGTVAAAAITLEPEGGSSQPTMPIYALGKT